MTGALASLRVVEIAGLGPTPFAAMWLADHGARVIRIARPGARHVLGLERDVLDRGRDWLELDLKSPEGQATARALIGQADALIEGMRPGVMERLGLGPDDFPGNPRLVYGRMTGWGQAGPLAHSAGHDLTYLAITGALHAIGPADHPLPPMNLLGDFAGGSMYLVAGMLAAVLKARESGQGQVVDAAISDGVAHLMAMISGMRMAGAWQDRRQANILDGAAPYYGCYECACGGHLAIGAIEPQFWAELLMRIGLDAMGLPDRRDPAQWPALRAILAAHFRTRSRDDWARLLEGSDACAAPVLSIDEAPAHAHNRARWVHGDNGPNPAPLLSRTPGVLRPGRKLQPAEALEIWCAQP
ncbi:CaiB/BaiF CoA transferase family protein [Paracoccus lutimaris]|uniref:Alpha-methylacyl-CoA racemase n=1 Tax=Paracoccus lutimaris TaxID=1490030 RepID=A0A368YV16_9RHOB|nr:CaiB/BaiF CoA-transferase family protein [Paracoccus lutimaris]RCW83459.1 alpha-methylacyl-CoA racemase [Paracoccus lutimaris]